AGAAGPRCPGAGGGALGDPARGRQRYRRRACAGASRRGGAEPGGCLSGHHRPGACARPAHLRRHDPAVRRIPVGWRRGGGEAAEAKAAAIRREGGDASVLIADVLDEGQLEGARDRLLEARGRVDILVNAAGGNVARARSDNRPAFDVPLDALDEVLRLNLHGTLIPSFLFGAVMGRQASGSIVNISSMAARRVLSGVLGYSIAKAGIDTFTQWLAAELARRYGDKVRVNAVAPGFFVTEQNRSVLVNPDGSYTQRARAIIAHTPMGRLGTPDEIVGA